MLGFITRTTRDIKHLNLNKLLFNSLVYSGLEYLTPIWKPFQANKITKLEKIQRKFTRTVYFMLAKPRIDYDLRLTALNMKSLEGRKNYFDACLPHKIIAYPSLSEMFNILNFRHPLRSTCNTAIQTTGKQDKHGEISRSNQ